MPLVDVTAAGMLVDLARDLHAVGVELHLAHVVGQVRDILRRADVALPPMHTAIDEAVSVATRD
jgi:hypothetical protein